MIEAAQFEDFTKPHFEVPFVPIIKVQELPKVIVKLLAPLRFYSCITRSWHEAPAGFLTDGGSVPRLPIIYEIGGNKADEACYVHDLNYTLKVFPREICDRVLREAIIAMGHSEALADAFYAAVRIGGGSHWEPSEPRPQQEPHIAAALGLAR